MWHVCEEALSRTAVFGKPDWERSLWEYSQQLCRRFPLQQQEIEKWYGVCCTQFPLYVEWWGEHSDVKERTPFLQEQVFDVSYPLSSGRVARLRGKWDSVDLIGKGRSEGMWLQENKTKGDIDEPQLRRQLSSGFDIQTMFYLVALAANMDAGKMGKSKQSLRGVRYNVVRRPLSGGRGSISRREATQGAKCSLKSCRERPDPACDKCGGSGRVGAKPAETAAEFSARLADVIRSAHGPEWGMPPDEHYFFMRWNIDILSADVERFRRECLDPVLENLCDDWEWWNVCFTKRFDLWDAKTRQRKFPDHRRRHFVTPFGVYNSLAEGDGTDLDEYLRIGSTVGLHRADDLFPELKQ